MTPCIVWTKYISWETGGYGIRQYKGRLWKAHRAAWDETYGPIPEGMRVLHKCDNPPCINPEHLFLGTQGDNVIDMAAKGRHGKSTLTNQQVQEIRERRAQGEKGRALAAEYGVAPSTISRIANRVRRIYV